MYRVTYKLLGKQYIEADYFDEEGSFVVFRNEVAQVAAIPSADILLIELIKEKC